ncbi:MAG TPA: hypothetical protein VJ787_11175 [Thermoleophilia bacterium]|nr:hypothetical protein [Thermoleophilia bacterium]
MSIVEVIAWLMFGAIWVGLVTVAILVILMAFGVTRSVITARAAAVSKSIIPAGHQTARTR